MVYAPTHCAHGHKFVGGENVVVGSYSCRCRTRHMQWACLETGCDGHVYGPALGEQCRMTYGAGSGRECDTRGDFPAVDDSEHQGAPGVENH